jgi:hypothetical protein
LDCAGNNKQAIGFEPPEIDLRIQSLDSALAEADDQFELATGPVVSRIGDLWLLGSHRLYCGSVRLREARNFQQAQRRGDIEATSDARTIYGNQFQGAFVRIGGDTAVAVVKTYLENPLFSVEAALVLMAIANNQSSVPASLSRPFPSFGNVAGARAARAAAAAPTAADISELDAYQPFGNGINGH